MQETISDFLLVGKSQQLCQWAEQADALGILRCLEHLQNKQPKCKCCINDGRCGISSESCSLNLIPVIEAPNFDCSQEDVMILITPIKRQHINNDDVKMLLSLFLGGFDDSIICWQSYVNADGRNAWKRVDRPNNSLLNS